MTPFTCVVVAVHDGDGPLRCQTGQRIRVAGLASPDYTTAEPCRTRKPGYVCNDRLAERSRIITTRMVLGKALWCRPVDRSWQRIVAVCRLPDGRSLSCALIAAGAGERWDRYWRRYHMPECGGRDG